MKTKSLLLSMSLTAAGLGLLCAGCTTETSGYCESDKDCPSGERCNTNLNRCEAVPPDGGPDGPVVDDGGADLEPDQDTKLENGAPCADSSACKSGFCVDGVCCDGACDEPCRSCKLAGSEGTCTLASAGQDPDKDCAGTAPACGGTCDGQGQCKYPDTTTSCGAPSCAGGEITKKACDGKGGCVDEKQSCGGFACNAAGDACKTTCAAKSDCVGAFECVGGVCSNPQPLGSPCGQNDKACQSGFCRDGFCCDTDCNNPCAACNIGGKEGTCSPKPDGTSCGATTCTGSQKTEKQCKAGTCSDVKSDCGYFQCNSQTQDCHAACSTDAQCVAAAYCKATVCAKKEQNGYKPCLGTNQCASGYCVGSVCCDSACSPASACVDGAASSTTTLKSCATGTCQSTTKPCGNFKCNTGKTDCLTSCTSDTHCVTGLFCISGSCQKKPNGTACAADSECVSQHCVGTTSKVCCATACVVGPCQHCNSGTCTLLAAGTTCNGGTTACVNTAGKSYISRLQCDGSTPSCNPQEYQSCGTYKCIATPSPACRTSCTAHADCVFGVCDLFDLFGTKNKCSAASDICHVDKTQSPCGTGTSVAPFCAIQDCLDGTKKYTRVADGVYDENLTVKNNVEIIAPSTTGPMTNYGFAVNGAAKVTVRSSSGTVVAVNNKSLGLYGVAVEHQNAGSTIGFQGTGKLRLRSCDIRGIVGKRAYGLDLTGSSSSPPTAILEDVAMRELKIPIKAEVVHLDLDNVGIVFSDSVMVHETATLTLYNVVAIWNGGGIQTYGSDVAFDRVILGAAGGLRLENSSKGRVVNSLINNNSGVGVYLYNNSQPVYFVNVTVVNNGGREVQCDSSGLFYNSIVWDKNNTDIKSGSCSFEYSDVKGGASGTGNKDQDPSFIGVNPNEYRLTVGSPCVDAGNDSISVPGMPALPGQDVIGEKRMVDKTAGGTKVDMGAYELQ